MSVHTIKKPRKNRWNRWLETHNISFTLLSPEEKIKVRELYRREMRPQPPSTPISVPDEPSVTKAQAISLPEHLERLTKERPQPAPEPPPPPQPTSEVTIAPSAIWATMWDLVYRGRSAFQYHPVVRGYVSLQQVEAIWNLSDDQAAALGDASAQAWEKYIPKAHPANIVLQQLWPALALGASVLIVEKAKQEEWAKLIQLLQHGPAAPPESSEPRGPLAPVETPNGNGLREEFARAGAVTEEPPEGVGLRQAMTKTLGPTVE